MLRFRRGRLFVCLVLVLVVLSLVLAGCGGSTKDGDKNGNGDGNGDGDGNGNGDGNGDGGGDVDLSWFKGAWKSPSRVDPAVEFTVGELIESEKDPNTGDISYYYKGEIKCQALSGNRVTITEKPSYLPPAKIDRIHISHSPKATLLYVWGGFDNEEGGTVTIMAWKYDNKLYTYVEITDGDSKSIYTSSTTNPDIFTKQ